MATSGALAADSSVFGSQDLILEGNETLIVDDPAVTHEANIIVKDNATLVLDGTRVFLDQDIANEYSIQVQDQGTLVLQSGAKITSDAAYELTVRDQARLEVDEGTLTTDSGNVDVSIKTQAVLDGRAFTLRSASFSLEDQAQGNVTDLDVGGSTFRTFDESTLHANDASITIGWYEGTVNDASTVVVEDATFDQQPFFTSDQAHLTMRDTKIGNSASVLTWHYYYLGDVDIHLESVDFRSPHIVHTGGYGTWYIEDSQPRIAAGSFGSGSTAGHVTVVDAEPNLKFDHVRDVDVLENANLRLAGQKADQVHVHEDSKLDVGIDEITYLDVAGHASFGGLSTDNVLGILNSDSPGDLLTNVQKTPGKAERQVDYLVARAGSTVNANAERVATVTGEQFANECKEANVQPAGVGHGAGMFLSDATRDVLTVEVVDGQGAPIEGASVQLRDNTTGDPVQVYDPDQGEATSHRTTNQAGAAEYPLTAPGSYELAVEHQGATVTSSSFTFTTCETVTVTV